MNKSIADELMNLIKPDARVHAMWIGGSVAEGYADEYSDIDLYIDIEDGTEKPIFAKIEDYLKSKGEIDLNFLESSSPPYIHKVYHLAGTDPLHCIEITLHSHSHQIGMFERLRKIEVLFDKDGVTVFEAFDTASYEKMLDERRKFLIEKINVGRMSVLKEVRRKHFPDAMHNFQYWQVDPIVELARIKYCPRKVTYGLKHASRDLPEDTVKEIVSLYTINSINDFSLKIEEVRTMLQKYS